MNNSSTPSDLGGGHQLYLDPRGCALTGGDPEPALPARKRLGRQRSHETRSRDPRAENGPRALVPRRGAASFIATVAANIVLTTTRKFCATTACGRRRAARASTMITPLSRRSSRPSRPNWSGAGRGQPAAKPKPSSSNTSTASRTRPVGTQPWKAPPLTFESLAA